MIIKSVDRWRNVTFIEISLGGRVTCALSNGTPASLSYAGVPHSDVMECRFNLEACHVTDEQRALRIMRKFAPDSEHSIFQLIE